MGYERSFSTICFANRVSDVCLITICSANRASDPCLLTIYCANRVYEEPSSGFSKGSSLIVRTR